jgi:hypothetical protein
LQSQSMQHRMPRSLQFGPEIDLTISLHNGLNVIGTC